MHTVKLNGRKIQYKVLTPSDFLEDEEGVNFSFIKYEKQKTMYDRAMEECQPQKDQEKESLELYRSIVFKAVYLTDEEKNKLSFDDIYFLFIKIIVVSLKVFQDVKNISKPTALFYDTLAQRYGKTPIEILCPNGDYTELDAYFFNSFCCYIGKEHEHDIYLKQKARYMMKGRR